MYVGTSEITVIFTNLDKHQSFTVMQQIFGSSYGWRRNIDESSNYEEFKSWQEFIKFYGFRNGRDVQQVWGEDKDIIFLFDLEEVIRNEG